MDEQTRSDPRWLYVRANRVVFGMMSWIAALTILSYAKDQVGWDPVGLVIAAACATLGVRGAISGVRLDNSKVVVRNFFRTRSLPLSEVTGTTFVRPWYAVGWSVLALTRKRGRPVVAVNLSPGIREGARRQVEAARLAIDEAVTRSQGRTGDHEDGN